MTAHTCDPNSDKCSDCGEVVIECRVCGRCMKTDKRCPGWRRVKR